MPGRPAPWHLPSGALSACLPAAYRVWWAEPTQQLALFDWT
jgi:hypothetical protein